MSLVRGILIACAVLGQATTDAVGEEPWRVNPAGQQPDDARLDSARNLRDEYHPWIPPATLGGMGTRVATDSRTTACGVRPVASPTRTPLEPVIHGTIDRGDYTVSRVYFASRPGHYVTGSLYRPGTIDGPVPGVLCPHGHWREGRFYDAGPDEATRQLGSGAEDFQSGARFPLQARMVQLARMGCVVFHYDMVGYADSRVVDHRSGFNDAAAELWMDNKLGLQTWNSIRALDFVTSLPEVDQDRIGVTGASGGGTQTFLLCALDPRPTVAFPAVMVSTGMQGGCVCENASYLRIGINNIAMAALCAPRPMALSGADDWTVRIETHGLPELKQIYSLYDSSALVAANTWAEFPHNYNQRSREMMYDWFNTHLRLESSTAISQSDFWPLSPEELVVFDEEHPLPDDVLSAEELRAELQVEHEHWFADLIPESAAEIDEYRRIISAAARVMFDQAAGGETATTLDEIDEEQVGKYQVYKTNCSRSDAGEQVPMIAIAPTDFDGTAVLWFDDSGKQHLFDDSGELIPAAVRLLESGMAMISADLFGTGEFVGVDEEFATQVDTTYPGYTFGYNPPLLSQRVHDVLTVVGAARARDDIEQIHLVGTGDAGAWVLLARGLMGDAGIIDTIVDLQSFSFADVTDSADPMLLPGALRYGNIGGLAALAAPATLVVHGVADDRLEALRSVYSVAGGSLSTTVEELDDAAVVNQILSIEN